MISLMYLVFIAMLALNVSKEVLEGFGQFFVKMEKSSERVESGNQVFYDKIATNAREKKGEWIQSNNAALEMKAQSETLFETIEDLKERIVAKKRESDPELKEYERMDTSEELDLILFKAEGPSEEGQAFVEAIRNYKDEIINFAWYEDLLRQQISALEHDLAAAKKRIAVLEQELINTREGVVSPNSANEREFFGRTGL